MSLPEGYLPRKGDTLLIRVDVRSDYRVDDDGLVSVAVTGSPHRTLFADFGKIHSLYCRHWNEGDRVREIGDHAMVGPVVAIFEDYVWVKIDKGENAGAMLTFSANEIEPEPLPAPGSQSVVGDDEEIKF